MRRLLIAFAMTSLLAGSAIVLLEGVAPWTWALAAFRDVSPTTASSRLPGLALALSLLWASSWCAVVVLIVARLAVRRGGGPMAVAHLVLDQAMRSRGLLVPIGVLLLILALLPFEADAATPVRFRIQSYLTYALAAIGLTLSVLTIFLAASTVSGDLAEGQARDLFVKPVRFGWYVLGKCFGLALWNGALVTAAGLVVYGSTVFYLAVLEPTDAYDAFAVREEVLAARHGVRPERPAELRARALEALTVASRNPDWIRERGGRERVLADLTEQELTAWRSIGPRQERTFIFRGLNAGAAAAPSLQLRYRIEMQPAPPDRRVRLGLVANGESFVFPAVVGSAQVLSLPADVLAADGTLALTISHTDPRNPEWTVDGSVAFSSGGLELLYRTGSFEMNFVKVFVVLWTHLVFLGALGITAATFLSFAVAAILSFCVWLLATVSTSLLSVLDVHRTRAQGGGVSAFLYDHVVIPVTGALSNALATYSSLEASTRVVSGRAIPGVQLAEHAFWIGGVWAGTCLLVAWMILARREIARVQV